MLETSFGVHKTLRKNVKDDTFLKLSWTLQA